VFYAPGSPRGRLQDALCRTAIVNPPALRQAGTCLIWMKVSNGRRLPSTGASGRNGRTGCPARAPKSAAAGCSPSPCLRENGYFKRQTRPSRWMDIICSRN